jgi:uncharacterized membrane protein YpjA
MSQLAWCVRRLYAIPLVEWGLVVVNVAGFAVGALYWYGVQIARTSPLLWPWLVDSPLGVLCYAVVLPLIRRGRGPRREWLATWAVFANVKYGLWTVIYWLLWWTGPGFLQLESVTLTLTHAAMVAMGASLLVFFRPRPWQVLTVAAWFAFNDYLDYWGGLTPRVPPGVSLEVLKWEQVIVTALLTLGLLALAWPIRARE